MKIRRRWSSGNKDGPTIQFFLRWPRFTLQSVQAVCRWKPCSAQQATLNSTRSSMASYKIDMVLFVHDDYDVMCWLLFNNFYRPSLSAGRSSPEKDARLSVCLSVCQTRWLTKRKKNLSRFFSALHECQRGLAMRKVSVRLSVWQTSGL